MAKQISSFHFYAVQFRGIHEPDEPAVIVFVHFIYSVKLFVGYLAAFPFSLFAVILETRQVSII